MTGNAINPPIQYMARITTMYRDTPRLIIDGSTNASSTISFSDAQAVIDVTGKAQDVLRRIKVRVPLLDFKTENLPLGAIHSQADVCKRFTASPVMYGDDCTGVLWASGGSVPAVSSYSTSCDPSLNSNCPTNTGGGGTAQYWFTKTFQNMTTNNTADILSCIWSWGDGTPDATTSCNRGDIITHQFARRLDPAGNPICYQATVSLTIVLRNGSSSTKASTYTIPFSRAASPYCP